MAISNIFCISKTTVPTVRWQKKRGGERGEEERNLVGKNRRRRRREGEPSFSRIMRLAKFGEWGGSGGGGESPSELIPFLPAAKPSGPRAVGVVLVAVGGASLTSCDLVLPLLSHLTS